MTNPPHPPETNNVSADSPINGQSPEAVSIAPNNKPAIWIPPHKETGRSFAVAAAILFFAYSFLFQHIHPECVPFMTGHRAESISIPGKGFIPVSVGGAHIKDDSLVIEGFNGDEAIVALPRLSKAEDYPFVKVNLSGFTQYSIAKLLRRTLDHPNVSTAWNLTTRGMK